MTKKSIDRDLFRAGRSKEGLCRAGGGELRDGSSGGGKTESGGSHRAGGAFKVAEAVQRIYEIAAMELMGL